MRVEGKKKGKKGKERKGKERKKATVGDEGRGKARKEGKKELEIRKGLLIL